MRSILAVLLALSFTAHASREGDEYRLTSPSEAQLRVIAREFSVVRREGRDFDFFVPAPLLPRFKTLAPSALRIPSEDAKALDSADYRTYESVGAELKALEQQYPELVKLEVYGKTKSGHNLYALKVSDNVAQNEDEPELMLTSATHGDELISVEVNMNLLRELLEGHGKDARLTKMVDEHELYYIPMVNPEGFSQRTRSANGWIDPNRDYPYPKNPTRESVDCIAGIIAFFNAHDFKGSLDIHASGKMVMYPWAYTYDALPSAEDQQFRYLVNSMAEQNHYAAGQISKVIYIAEGSSADYYYWKKKTTAIAVELTTSKVPPVGRIPAVVAEAREMIWRFIEHF